MRYPFGFAAPMVNERLAGAGKSRTRLQEARQMRDEQDGEKGFALSIPLAVGIRWCPEEDSNLHASRHTDLNRARLPIPPSGLVRAHVSGPVHAVERAF